MVECCALLQVICGDVCLSNRYLYTEWGDPTFGARAAFVHKKFQDAKPSSDTQSSISKQCGLMARLRHVVNELKVIPSCLGRL